MTASIRRFIRPAGALLALGLFALPLHARTMFGVTAANALVRFDDATPGSIVSNMTITGLQPGETVLGIDFRPLDETLFALGSTSRLYRLDPVTAIATQVGTGTFLIPLQGSSFGFDFNPTVDRIRVVSDANQNLRLNPNDGSVVDFDTVTPGVQPDLNLAYAGGDPNVGADPVVVGSGYTNSSAGATTTTLYGIDSGVDRLVIHSPPNNGTLTTVGGAGLGVDTTSVVGFDILETNVARAALVVSGVTRLYGIDLATGAATTIGSIGADIRALAAGPAGYTATLAGSTVTFTAGAGQQVLRIDSSGGLLRHNRSSVGNSGFSSDFDFDPSTPGDQTLSASDPSVSVSINAGSYDDLIAIGSAAAPSGSIAANFNINGGVGHDVLEIDDSANAITGRNVTINPTSVAGLSGGIVHGSLETIVISAGGGADNVVVGASLATTTLRTGGGNDIVVFNTTGSLAGGLLDGGAGTDTVDMSFYSPALTFDLVTNRTLFLSRDSGMQEPGPLSNSGASGNGVFVLDPAQTTLSVQQGFRDLVGATITGLHLHNAAAGTNGAIVRGFDAEAATLSPPGGSFSTNWRSTDPVSSPSGPLTPALVAELNANRIYLNLHTNLFPSGELRGQLLNHGAVGVLSGTGGIRGFEIVDRSLFQDGFEG